MLRRLQKSLLSLVAVTAVLAGCTQGTYGPDPDRRPVDPTVNTPLAPSSPLQAADAEAHASADVFVARAAHAKDFASVRDQIVDPLANLILQPAVLKNVSAFAENEFYTDLRVYHQGLLDLARLDQVKDGQYSADVVKRFALYEKTILAPCYDDVHACQPLSVATRDRRSTEVILKLTQVLKLDADRLWRYSFFALDMNGQPLPLSQQSIFFANAEHYIASLERDDSTATAAKALEAAQRLNQAVTAFGNKSQAVEEFYDRINIWSPQEQDPVASALHRGLWKALMQKGPYNSDPRHSLSASFSRWEGQSLTQFDKEVIAPFQAESRDATMQEPCAQNDDACTARHAQAAQLARMWISYQLTDPHALDPRVTFILDQAFNEKINRADALSLLEASHADVRHVLTVANALVRVRVAKMVYDTHRALKPLLGDADDYHDIARLRDHLSAANSTLDPQWAQFVQKIRVVGDVVNSFATAEYLYLPEDLQTLYNTTFGQMDRDIKWLAIYPNMLPVMYFISTSNLSQSFSFMWFTVTLNSDSIFSMLFQGQLESWFNFTNAMEDRSSLSSPEVVLAFRNALATEVFSDYGISPGSFLLEAAKRLTATSITTLDNSNASLYDSLYIGKKYNSGFSNVETDVFRRATGFCRGEPVPEIMNLKDLTRQLVAFESDLTDTAANAAIYWLPIKDGNGRGVNTIGNYTDVLRTNDLYMVDLLLKMREIYQGYLDQHHMSDPLLEAFDQRIDQYRARVRKYLSYVYYATNRFEPCLNKVERLSIERKKRATDYEQEYLKQAYRDYATLQNDPSQLEAINARYKRTYPEINASSLDGFSVTDRGVVFNYSRRDFMMRLKGYMQQGYVTADGGKLPAIAPGMIINVPLDALKDNRTDYNWVIDPAQAISVQVKESGGEAEFLAEANHQFYNETSYLGQTPLWQARPFTEWFGPSASSNYYVMMGAGTRLKIQGALMKFGPQDVYDFEKPGCSPDISDADLDAKCVTKMSFPAEKALASQLGVIDTISLTPEDIALLNISGTPSLYGDSYGWESVFFSRTDHLPFGLFDSYLYMLSNQVLGNNLIWPGQRMDDSFSPQPREGLLDRAKTYYQAFGSHNEGNLLTVPPGMDGDIKGLYQSYVDAEFRPQRELEALINKLATHGSQQFSLKLEVKTPAYVLPLVSGTVPPSSVQQNQFDRKTDFLFAKPGL